jgi:hypothetical protein
MRLAAALFCFALYSEAVSAAPAAPPDWKQPEVAYSATRTEFVLGIEKSQIIYFDQGRERSEEIIQDALYISIYIPQDKALYVFAPSDTEVEKACMDFAEFYDDGKSEGRIKSEVVGRETVQGESVTKYRVEILDGRRWYTTFVWVTEDGIVMRTMDAKGGFGFELSNLRRGPQPAELFELPDGVGVVPDPVFCRHD